MRQNPIYGNCTSLSSWQSPLVNPHENYINPCFLTVLISCWNITIGVACIFQTANILFNNKYGYQHIRYSFGNPFLKESVGAVQLIKLALIVLQIICILVLPAISETNNPKIQTLLIQGLVLLFVVFPAHILESTRSVVASTSLLIYWLMAVFYLTVIAIVDTVSPYKVYSSGSRSFLGLEVCMLINALYILWLELACYSPSVELMNYYELNAWNKNNVYNIFKDFAFWWMDSSIRKVFKTDHLDFNELEPELPEIDVKHASMVFEENWKKAVESAKCNFRGKDIQDLHVSLYGVIIRSNWVAASRALFWHLLEFSLLFCQPFLLQRFLIFYTEFITARKEDELGPPFIEGAFITILLFFVAVFRFVSFNRGYNNIYLTNLLIRSAISKKIYDKAMNLSPEARKVKATGDIVNSMSVDVTFVERVFETMLNLFTEPIRLAVCLLSLHKVLGNATWFGFVVSVIIMPVCVWMNSRLYWYYNRSVEFKDERTRLTADVLNSIKSIKLYSWEKPIIERMNEVRNNKELNVLQELGILEAFSVLLWRFIPFFMTCACLMSFSIMLHGKLYPSVIFPALALLQILSEPILNFPMKISDLIESNISNKRLSKLFLLEEFDDNVVKRSYKKVNPHEVSISLKNATFVWPSLYNDDKEESSPIALRSVDFEARKGELSCIVGNVGSGKTSLLRATLGEIQMTEGDNSSVEVIGSIAFCSQSPWILNATIRENILFGAKFDKEFYWRTLEACQLLPDLDILSEGDHTTVGEKGISLSGGQKARVSLARAVYSRADIYLLDDILSAVDVHVGRNIISRVISKEGILSSKTIVLSTNNVNVLKHSDNIVLLKGGSIVERGIYTDMLSKDSEISRLISEFSRHLDEIHVDPLGAQSPFSPAILQSDVNADFSLAVARKQSIGAASAVSLGHDYGGEFDDFDEEYYKKKQSEEIGAKGKVNFKVYIEYFKACNFGFIFVYVIFYSVMVASEVGMNYILTNWSDENLKAGHNVDTAFYVLTYTALGITGAIFYFFGSVIVWKYSCIYGSRYFHDRMFKNILRAPMSFFETTPIGRLLNRFTEDINVIDFILMWQWTSLVDVLLHMFALFGVIVINLPLMIVIIIVLAVIYNSYRNYFIPFAREIKRLTSAYRSPIISSLQESMNGLETIRAYGQKRRFSQRNTKFLEQFNRASYSDISVKRWLSMRLNAISATILLFTTILILSTLVRDPFTLAMVGFIMTYAMNITSSINAIIQIWAELETRSIAVERLLEYCRVPTEALMEIEEAKPPVAWPQSGSIEFINYSTKYRDNSSPVLKNINVTIKPQEKVGIVGRTGAGKSSLTMALFRIIEPTEGYIEIDNINTSTLGLFDLRRHLGIIPQDSQTIEGTVRQNLDPFGQYSDTNIWRVLDLAHLKGHVEQMETKPNITKINQDKGGQGEHVLRDAHPTAKGLDAVVDEGGANLSAGQKQLMCLARALLNPSSILVLDEATASVDVQTDKIIQETIRKEFKDKTILTVAHRLETIMDSDKIMVLDNGELKEFGEPQELLKNEDGIFYLLCKEGGHI